MPARSKSQQRALFAKAGRGELPLRTAEEFAVKGNAYARLPERVKRKKTKK